MLGDGHEKVGRGFMFDGLTAYFDGSNTEASQRFFEFAGGKVSDSLEDSDVTHVVVAKGSERTDKLRAMCAMRRKMPRMVTTEWIDACWKERDRMDEEDYAP
jgi:hypothetical protein